MNCLILTIFFAEVLCCLCMDWYRFRTLLTPGIVLVLPFTLVLLVALLFAESLDFVPFYIPGLLIWILGFGAFYAAACVVNIFFSPCHNVQPPDYKISMGGYGLIVFATLPLVAMVLKNCAGIGTKELAAEVFQGGLRGRLANLTLLFVPLIAWSQGKMLLKIGTLAIFLLLLVSFGSKTYLMGAFIAVVFMGICRKKIKISLSLAVILFIICIGCFILYYGLLLDINIDTFFYWVCRHFFFYLTSGVLPLGEIVREEFLRSSGSNLPFYDLLASWFSWSPAFSEAEIWVLTDNIRGTESNVFTFFGAIYLTTQNYFTFMFYSFFWGIFTSFFFNMANKTQSIFLQVANSWLLVGLSFGGVAHQLKLLRFFEIIMYCLFFYCLCNILFWHAQGDRE